MESGDNEQTLDFTGENFSQKHVGSQSRLANAYGSPVNVRERNVRRITPRREDVAEPRSNVANRVVRNSNFASLESLYYFLFNFLT